MSLRQEAAAAAEAQLLRARKESDDLQSEVARLVHDLKEKTTPGVLHCPHRHPAFPVDADPCTKLGSFHCPWTACSSSLESSIGIAL